MRWAAILSLAAACGGGDDEGDGARCPACSPGTLVWSGIAGSETRALIGAVAPSPGEPPWFAGSYDQDLTVAGRTDDVDPPPTGALFVARVAPRDLGGPYLGTGSGSVPVTAVGVAPDGEEGAIAIVHAAPAVGDQLVEAVWIGRAETTVQRAVLATVAAPAPGGPVAVSAVDPRGWPIVAVSGSGIDLGEPAPVPEARAVVLRVGQGLRREVLFARVGIEIFAVAATDDAVVIGGRYSGAPPEWPECAEPSCGFVAAVNADSGGEQRWLRVVRAADGAAVRAVAANAGGFTVALAELSGTPLDGLPTAAMLLLRHDAAGDDRGDLVLADTAPDLNGRALAVAADGTIVLALSLRGTVTLPTGDFSSDASGDHDGLVAAFAPDGDQRWALPLRSATDLAVAAVAVAGDQVAVGGWFRSTLSVPSGALADSPITSPQGWVVELIR